MAIKKLVGLGKTAIASNFTTLQRPYKLNFSITYKCQSRCLTCNIWKLKPTNELSIEEIKKFAEKNNFFRWIELTGGEPFLRSDIVEIARTFHETSKDLYLLTMPTNSLCNETLVLSKVEEILKLGIPKLAITVSLDGHRELHDKIRGVPGNYDRAIRIFKGLQELKKQYPGLFSVFGYTMSKYNQGEFQKTYDSVKEEIPSITYNDFHVNLGQISSAYYGNQEMDLKTANDIAANELSNIVKRRQTKFDGISLVEATFLKKLLYYVKTGRQPMKSKSLEASLFLDSYGNVYPSIMWDTKIGNIRDTDYNLSGIWKSSQAESIRKMIKEGKEPTQWTSCEAYQAITGNLLSLISS